MLQLKLSKRICMVLSSLEIMGPTYTNNSGTLEDYKKKDERIEILDI